MATPAKSEKPKNEKDEKTKVPPKPKAPSKAQLQDWVSSIKSLLNDPEGMEAFRVFLEKAEIKKGELTRYIDFVEDCQMYRAEFLRLEDQAKSIFDTYLDIGAEKEVASGGKAADIGDKLEDEGLEGVTLFEEPLEKVIQKLEKEQYIMFCKDLKEKYKL